MEFSKTENTVKTCKDCGKVTKGYHRCYQCNIKHKENNKPVKEEQTETKEKTLYYSGTVCKFCAYDKFTPEEVKEIMNNGYFFNSNPCSGCKARWHASQYI